MGSKLSNAQVAASPAQMSQGIASAFGDSEEDARKRQQQEDEAQAAQARANQQAANPSVPSVWDTMKSMGQDAAGGMASAAADTGSSVWSAMMKKKSSK